MSELIYCCRNGYKRCGSIHDAEKAPQDIPRRRLDLNLKKNVLRTVDSDQVQLVHNSHWHRKTGKRRKMREDFSVWEKSGKLAILLESQGILYN